MTDWYRKTVLESTALLDSDPQTGLSEEQILSRLITHGPNELAESGGRSPWRILWEQISGAMVVLLFVAAIVSLILSEHIDTVVILAIVIINAVLGFVQEYRAERALAALKKLAVPTVRVRRGGGVHEISARDLVPGDVVLLEVGNYVPADCRLLETVNLKTQESALTGESAAVSKQTAPLGGAGLALGDRTNQTYMGTIVTYGHGLGLVTATGMNTELGKIARSLQNVEAGQTPLQRRLTQLGQSLALIAIAIVGLVFAVGWLHHEDVQLLLMTSLSLAVAVVPEGLPAVATVALALGARRMFSRRALIRKLPAVETLGSVTVICADKTGTLTQNRMTATVLDLAGARIDLTDLFARQDRHAGAPDGELQQLVTDYSSLAMLLAGAALCNDAELEQDDPTGAIHAIGDPTESALVVAAARLGLPKNHLVEVFPREAEIPFDSERKRMTTVHRVRPATAFDGERENAGEVRREAGGRLIAERSTTIGEALAPIAELDGEHVAFTKGAVDSLAEVCDWVWDDGQPVPMDESWRQRIATASDELAASGMRVLGVAFRPLDAVEKTADAAAESAEEDLIFLGMLGLIDPPRAEVADAVARCRSAGIRPIMITGDHPLTAKHIARQLNITDNDNVMTGQSMSEQSPAELVAATETTSVFARVSPQHKLDLVQSLQDNGHVVAMTGDGVNDAPALKQAQIGVAMGITGTDVSKEASQMVLLDDNFATIVGAVEEGRIVYDNIRKFVKYTMTSNAGEIWVMLLGPLLGMPLPLMPLQILWVNLVTDGLPGLALAVEKAERNTMQRPPYPPGQHIFGQGMGWDIAWIGLLMGIVSLAFGFLRYQVDPSDERHWQTLIFTVLTMAQMGNALAIRSDRDSLFRIGVFSNRPLLGAVVLTLGLQLLVVYWRPLQEIFDTQALSFSDLMVCVALSTIVFWFVEIQKWFKRRQP